MDERLAPCPDSDAMEVTGIEVSFAIPTHVTQLQQQRLLDILGTIVDAPYNQVKTGPHWIGFIGGRMSNYSAADAALLGKPTPDKPLANGEEPEFDDDVFCVESHYRTYYDDEDRKRLRRPREDYRELGGGGIGFRVVNGDKEALFKMLDAFTERMWPEKSLQERRVQATDALVVEVSHTSTLYVVAEEWDKLTDMEQDRLKAFAEGWVAASE